MRVVARILGFDDEQVEHNHAFVGSLDIYNSFKFVIWDNANGVSYVILVGMIHDFGGFFFNNQACLFSFNGMPKMIAWKIHKNNLAYDLILLIQKVWNFFLSFSYLRPMKLKLNCGTFFYYLPINSINTIMTWKREKSYEGPFDHSNQFLWVLQSQTIPHFEFLTHSAVKGPKPMYLPFFDLWTLWERVKLLVILFAPLSPAP